jgi:hypothetical protein
MAGRPHMSLQEGSGESEPVIENASPNAFAFVAQRGSNMYKRTFSMPFKYFDTLPAADAFA